MTIRTRKLRTALLKKGFQEDKTHHNMYWLVASGRKRAIRTRISHSKKDIDDGLIALTATELRLSKREFLLFVDCTLSGQDYVNTLLANGNLKI